MLGLHRICKKCSPLILSLRLNIHVDYGIVSYTILLTIICTFFLEFRTQFSQEVLFFF